MALRQSNLRLISQELRAAQDRFDVGEITRTDVSIAEARLAASRAALASAEGQLMIAREAYKAATGAYPQQLAALPKAPAASSEEDCRARPTSRSHRATWPPSAAILAAQARPMPRAPPVTTAVRSRNSSPCMAASPNP